MNFSGTTASPSTSRESAYGVDPFIKTAVSPSTSHGVLESGDSYFEKVDPPSISHQTLEAGDSYFKTDVPQSTSHQALEGGDSHLETFVPLSTSHKTLDGESYFETFVPPSISHQTLESGDSYSKIVVPLSSSQDTSVGGDPYSETTAPLSPSYETPLMSDSYSETAVPLRHSRETPDKGDSYSKTFVPLSISNETFEGDDSYAKTLVTLSSSQDNSVDVDTYSETAVPLTPSHETSEGSDSDSEALVQLSHSHESLDDISNPETAVSQSAIPEMAGMRDSYSEMVVSPSTCHGTTLSDDSSTGTAALPSISYETMVNGDSYSGTSRKHNFATESDDWYSETVVPPATSDKKGANSPSNPKSSLPSTSYETTEWVDAYSHPDSESVPTTVSGQVENISPISHEVGMKDGMYCNKDPQNYPTANSVETIQMGNQSYHISSTDNSVDMYTYPLETQQSLESNGYGICSSSSISPNIACATAPGGFENANALTAKTHDLNLDPTLDSDILFDLSLLDLPALISSLENPEQEVSTRYETTGQGGLDFQSVIPSIVSHTHSNVGDTFPRYLPPLYPDSLSNIYATSQRYDQHSYFHTSPVNTRQTGTFHTINEAMQMGETHPVIVDTPMEGTGSTASIPQLPISCDAIVTGSSAFNPLSKEKCDMRNTCSVPNSNINKDDLDKLFENLEEDDKLTTSDPDPAIVTKMYTHQKQALHWMINQENSNKLPPFWEKKCGKYLNSISEDVEEKRPRSVHGGILADDMGLGKTLVVIALILTNGQPITARDDKRGLKRKRISLASKLKGQDADTFRSRRNSGNSDTDEAMEEITFETQPKMTKTANEDERNNELFMPVNDSHNHVQETVHGIQNVISPNSTISEVPKDESPECMEMCEVSASRFPIDCVREDERVTLELERAMYVPEREEIYCRIEPEVTAETDNGLQNISSSAYAPENTNGDYTHAQSISKAQILPCEGHALKTDNSLPNISSPGSVSSEDAKETDKGLQNISSPVYISSEDANEMDHSHQNISSPGSVSSEDAKEMDHSHQNIYSTGSVSSEDATVAAPSLDDFISSSNLISDNSLQNISSPGSVSSEDTKETDNSLTNISSPGSVSSDTKETDNNSLQIISSPESVSSEDIKEMDNHLQNISSPESVSSEDAKDTDNSISSPGSVSSEDAKETDNSLQNISIPGSISSENAKEDEPPESPKLDEYISEVDSEKEWELPQPLIIDEQSEKDSITFDLMKDMKEEAVSRERVVYRPEVVDVSDSDDESQDRHSPGPVDHDRGQPEPAEQDSDGELLDIASPEDNVRDSEEGSRLCDGPKGTLIVCPLSVMDNWRSQLQAHVRKDVVLYLHTYHGSNRNTDLEFLRQQDIVMTTYTTVARDAKSDRASLKKVFWLRLVLDEGHAIRNPKAQQTKAILELKAKRKWVLTGTPIQNSIRDLWSLVRFLQLSPLTDKHCWLMAIEQPLLSKQECALKRVRHLMGAIALRRTKTQEVAGKRLVELPNRKVYVDYVKLRDDERKVYDAMQKKGQLLIRQYILDEVVLERYGELLVALLRLRQLCCHPQLVAKALAVPERETHNLALMVVQSGSDEECSICLDSLRTPVITPCGHLFCKICIEKSIRNEQPNSRCPMCRSELTLEQPKEVPPEIQEHHAIVEQTELQPSAKVEALMDQLTSLREHDPTVKSLVVSQFTSFLRILEIPLREHGFTFTKLDGTMSAGKRREAMEEFSVPGADSPSIMLLSLKAGGVGINLVAASRVFLMEPAWNPASEEQCFDRCHRLGQTRDVVITKFVIEDSVEERMLELQEKKRQLMQGAFKKRQSPEQRRNATISNLKNLMNV